ncbi:hypothetical protein [Saccharothrix hoggarensis]|uniref:Uncharacterized protein n=1 Tax=Saccharothrix hoggarensis TaxID=913853 RepID=A0ABW3QSP3_9PSEU
MARWFGRRDQRDRGQEGGQPHGGQPHGGQPQKPLLEQLAEAMGVGVAGPVNDIHLSPTQHKVHDAMITRPSGLVAVLESLSQCSQLIPPGVVENPTTLEVPVTGHNVVLSLVNDAKGPVVVTDLRAVFTSFLTYDFPAQLFASAPGPMAVLTEDLRTSAEESVGGNRPLEKPHYEVHLSAGVRPLVVEALLPDGERPREQVPVPLTLEPGGTARIVLAPVTHLPECIGWRLVLRWLEDGAELYAAWDLLVTGNTCWRQTDPAGESGPRPAGDLGHWDPHTYYRKGHDIYHDRLEMTVQPTPAWSDAIRRAREQATPPTP